MTKKRKNIFNICCILIGIFIMIIIAENRISNKYSTIKKVSVIQNHPPFKEYVLTNSEIDMIVTKLKEINLDKYEKCQEKIDGDPDIISIRTNDNEWKLILLKPYLGHDGELYLLGLEHSLWNVIDEICE